MLTNRCEAALLKVAVTILGRAEPRLLELWDLEKLLTHLKVDVPGGCLPLCRRPAAPAAVVQSI
jgi:hypothetical protein